MAFSAGILFLSAFPWQTRVTIPALLRSKAIIRIYPPFSAQIKEVHIREGDAVQQGDPLFLLDSSELKFNESIASGEVEFLGKQLMRLIGHAELMENSMVIQQQLAGALTKLQGLRARKAQLIIRAPADGTIVDLEETLRPDLWIRDKQHLASLIDRRNAVIEGFLEEQDLGNIRVGNHGRFYPESGDTAPVDCTITEIDPASTRHLKKPYLASTFGGDVPVTESAAEGGQWKIRNTVYRVIFIPDIPTTPPDRVVRGSVRIQGRPRSLFSRAWLRIQAVLIRESGF